MDETENEKQYIYIVQASLESSKCKIGKTNDLDRRLKEYNNITGVSKENAYQYLFTCEVQDMAAVENDIKGKFGRLREIKNKEIYFHNEPLFEDYINFIKGHRLFIKEIFVKTEAPKEILRIVKKTTPTLDDRGMSYVDVMNRARKVQNDEFYTRYEDVEKELSMYAHEIWQGKCVFCNCDDAVDDEKDERRTSAFALYFIRNFDELGLKKLICTHYAGKVDLFKQGSKGYVYTLVITEEGFEDDWEYPTGFDGSFDHPISLKILNEEADIVCTNPPFSRSIEYWKILIESGKKFIIVSNIVNAVTTAFIPYFKDNKVWAGYDEIHWFLNPKRELTRAAGSWFTNIPINDRPKSKNLKIMPLKKIPEKYKKYDNAKMLVVDNNYIPSDYKKPFAVSSTPILSGVLEKGYKIIDEKVYHPDINGKKKFARVLVQKI
ncbi:MAG: GIY-YIG nuclease family protein [Ignavibacteria bacterium]|jgi:predicted GIY-YIG superfamily endonuclease|nr:GIY-YIG nuclease family protein [Ignavibacteria bacterium]